MRSTVHSLASASILKLIHLLHHLDLPENVEVQHPYDEGVNALELRHRGITAEAKQEKGPQALDVARMFPDRALV